MCSNWCRPLYSAQCWVTTELWSTLVMCSNWCRPLYSGQCWVNNRAVADIGHVQQFMSSALHRAVLSYNRAVADIGHAQQLMSSALQRVVLSYNSCGRHWSCAAIDVVRSMASSTQHCRAEAVIRRCSNWCRPLYDSRAIIGLYAAM
jgi:hypothetical protein